MLAILRKNPSPLINRYRANRFVIRTFREPQNILKRNVSYYFLSKMFEKWMCARLDSYPKSNNILYTNQFGFRKRTNTSDVMIDLFYYVYSSFDKQSTTLYIWISQRHSTLLIMTYWWINSCRMASEVSFRAGFKSDFSNKQHVSGKNPVPVCQTLHYVRLGAGPSTFSFVHQWHA